MSAGQQRKLFPCLPVVQFARPPRASKPCTKLLQHPPLAWMQMRGALNRVYLLTRGMLDKDGVGVTMCITAF